MTHCGLHGVMEAVYYGVPMVGMPIFIDQGDTLIKMKEKEIAVGLNKDTATVEEIYQCLIEILSNPKYKRKVDKLSSLMRDAKETPLERVIEFTEYMIRHKGAEHLKLGSRHLNFIQYFCLDTLAFILLILISVIYILYKCIKLIFRKFMISATTEINTSEPISNSYLLSNGKSIKSEGNAQDELDATKRINFASNISEFANSVSSFEDKKHI